MSITENVIPLAFAMGDLGYSLDNPMLLVELYFFFKGKVCMFFYMFSCYEVGLFFLREVLLYLWHQRSDSVFSLREKVL